MAHKVIPLKTWVTPNRAIAKEDDIGKNSISICDTDYEWLEKQEKELGQKIFKDVSEPKKKVKKESFSALPKLKRMEVK